MQVSVTLSDEKKKLSMLCLNCKYKRDLDSIDNIKAIYLKKKNSIKDVKLLASHVVVEYSVLRMLSPKLRGLIEKLPSALQNIPDSQFINTDELSNILNEGLNTAINIRPEKFVNDDLLTKEYEKCLKAQKLFLDRTLYNGSCSPLAYFKITNEIITYLPFLFQS